MKKRTTIFFAVVIVSALICFGVLPLAARKTRAVAEVVRIVGDTSIKRGAQIREGDVQLVEVGAYGLPDDAAKSTKDVIGKYALSDIYPSDNITSERVAPQMPLDENLSTIQRGTCALSVQVPSLAAGFSGKLQKGDVVSVYGVRKDDLAEHGVSVSLDESLMYMEVLSVSNSKAAAADADTAEKSEDAIAATITLRCRPEQAAKLIEIQNVGTIHIAFVGRSEEALSQLAAFNEYLAKQSNTTTIKTEEQ